MQMITRKTGSQRASRPKSVEIEQNWGGQGGSQKPDPQNPGWLAHAEA